jgi:hypothetical protein
MKVGAVHVSMLHMVKVLNLLPQFTEARGKLANKMQVWKLAHSMLQMDKFKIPPEVVDAKVKVMVANACSSNASCFQYRYL